MIPVIYCGSIEISTYWLMLFCGTVGMGVCTYLRRSKYALTGIQTVLFTLLLTTVGFAGAKLLYILENIKDTIESGISLSGVSFFGSVFLIPLLMPLIGRAFRLRPGQTMDLCGPCVAIMIGSMRLGCYLSGCCGGWEMCIGNISFRWPTQMLESIGDFCIMGVLLALEEHNARKNQLYPLFMLTYSVMRFLIEFLRETPKNWIGLSHGQWFSIAASALAVAWLFYEKREVKGENKKDNR